MMNRIDSLSGIKYLKTKYTKVIPVYTKIDVAGSIALVDNVVGVVGFAAVLACAVVVIGVVVVGFGLVEDIFTKK